MKNLFSSPPDLQKFIISNLELLLKEQRHQRADLASLNRSLRVLINDLHLQKQVEDFYETSPQTESIEQIASSDPNNIENPENS